LTTIDARIAGSAGLHQAATGYTGRTIVDVMKELRAVQRIEIQFSDGTILPSARTEERELFSGKEP
jgi:hypothetical protein